MSSQTRNLYSESKTRLCERISANIQSCGSGKGSEGCVCGNGLMRQMVKGSKSVETLSQSARCFAAQENTIENTSANLNKLQISTKQFQMQLEDINKSCEHIQEVVQKFQ